MANDRTQRIISIMEEENMNATQFAEAIGIQRAAMSHIMGGRNNPSADVLAKISERFDTINPGWLLSGKGNMRITSGSTGGVSMSGSNSVPVSAKYGNDNIKTASSVSINKEPDLFRQHEDQISAGSNIRTEIRFIDKKNEGEEIDELKNISKEIEKEVIIYKERPVKTIDKLLIFYSDNTFETFIAEKHEKE